MDHVINLLILYTFENGALTWYIVFIMRKKSTSKSFRLFSFATIISMLCVRNTRYFTMCGHGWLWFNYVQWLIMPSSKSSVVLAAAGSHESPPNRQNFHEFALCHQQTYGVYFFLYLHPSDFVLPQYTQIRWWLRAHQCISTLAVYWRFYII